MKNDIICWWSGGVTSAVAVKIACDIFGLDRCRFLMIDTLNEDVDTYRFKEDCERWYGKKIDTISAIGDKYDCIQDVWRKHKSLNVAHGAICSSELKREVRIRWEKENNYTHQVFGFDIKEPKRAQSMTMNYPGAKPIYPLLMFGYTKKKCIEILGDAGIEIPNAYKMGFHNNNCLQTGCVQGGIGYWQKLRRMFPDKFDAMAKMEHELTDAKGKPVTMLKDQSLESKSSGVVNVFLKLHPGYPEHKDISMMKGRDPKPMVECSAFGCSVNDLDPKKKERDQRRQMELFVEESQ